MRNLTNENITDEVQRAFRNSSDARMQQVMCCLVQHLHDFAREVQLSHEEWLAAINCLVKAGRMSDSRRNEFMLMSDIFGISSLVDLMNQPAGTTESSVLGPFHEQGAGEMSIGGDLIGDNEGEPVVFRGRVLAQEGQPIEGALLDIWQTAANGLYDSQDPNQPDGNFRCRMRTDAAGAFAFTTVRPRAYTVPHDGPVGDLLLAIHKRPWRPGHIHFIVSAEGYRPVVTELYADDDPHLNEDAVFGVRDSLVIHYERCESPDQAASHNVSAPFYTAEYDFRLAPL